MKRAISILLSVLLLFGSIPLSVFVASAESTLDTTNLAENYKYNSGAGEVSWDFGDRWNTDDPSVSAHGGYGWKIPQWNGWGGGNVYGKSICVKASGLETDTRYQFGFSNGGKFDMAVTKVYPVSNPSAMLELLNVQRTAVSNPIYTGYQWFDVKTDFVTNSTDTEYIVVIQATNTGRSGDEVAFADLKLYKYLSFGESFDVSVAVEGGGTATVSSTNVEAGATVTFTAAANHLETFLGWYDGENLVSSDSVYTPTITAATNLTAKFTAHTTSENLVKDFTKGNGITVTYTGWCNALSGTKTRYGGNGIQINDGDFDSATNGITLSVTLQSNTAYRFGFSNSNDHRMVLESVKSATGVLAPTVKASEPTNSGWIGTDYTFVTGDETDYVLTVTAYNRSKGDSHRANTGWSDAIVTDFALFELTDYDFSTNLALGYTNEGGEVTWTGNAQPVTKRVDKHDGALGGYSWRFGIGSVTEADPAYVTIKASGLEASTYYEFSYVYQKDYAIRLDTVMNSAENAVAVVTTPEDTKLSVGDRAHKVTFRFRTGLAGDYSIKLKMCKWALEPCGWDSTILSDLSLTKGDSYSGIVTASENKAAVRAASGSVKQGIRVKSTINKAWIDDASITQYGILAIRTARLDGAALTCDTTNAAKGVAYDAVTKPDAVLYEETETDNIYAGVMINIPERFYGQTYTVRSYAVSSDGDVFYGEVFTVCVFDVVEAILAAENASADDVTTANAIIAQAVAAKATDSSVVTYEEWLAAKA